MQPACRERLPCHEDMDVINGSWTSSNSKGWQSWCLSSEVSPARHLSWWAFINYICGIILHTNILNTRNILQLVATRSWMGVDDARKTTQGPRLVAQGWNAAQRWLVGQRRAHGGLTTHRRRRQGIGDIRHGPRMSLTKLVDSCALL